MQNIAPILALLEIKSIITPKEAESLLKDMTTKPQSSDYKQARQTIEKLLQPTK